VSVPVDFNFKLRQRITAHQQSTNNIAWWRWIQQPAFGVVAVMMAACGLWYYSYIQSPAHKNPVISYVPTTKLLPPPPGAAKNLHPDNVIAPSIAHAEVAPNFPPALTVSTGGRQAARHIVPPRVAMVGNRINIVSSSNSLNNEVKFIDKSGHMQAVPVTMVVYGAQPVVSLDTIDPDDLDGSNSGQEGSSIF
jgi:hypothetical protein